MLSFVCSRHKYFRTTGDDVDVELVVKRLLVVTNGGTVAVAVCARLACFLYSEHKMYHHQ